MQVTSTHAYLCIMVALSFHRPFCAAIHRQELRWSSLKDPHESLDYKVLNRRKPPNHHLTKGPIIVQPRPQTKTNALTLHLPAKEAKARETVSRPCGRSAPKAQRWLRYPAWATWGDSPQTAGRLPCSAALHDLRPGFLKYVSRN